MALYVELELELEELELEELELDELELEPLDAAAPSLPPPQETKTIEIIIKKNFVGLNIDISFSP